MKTKKRAAKDRKLFLGSALAPLLLLALLAPSHAEASLERASTPELAPASASLSIERALTLEESPVPEPRFGLFEGNEFMRATHESAQSFHPLAAVSLLPSETASVLDESYPKTRVWAFDAFSQRVIGVSSGLSVELHWGSARFSAGLASDEREDPLGLEGGPQNPTASEWALQPDEFRGLRPSAVPSRGEASIGSAFRKHASEVGVVVGGMATTVAIEAVIYYTQEKALEIGVRVVLRGATYVFRTLQEATAFAKAQGATVRYVEQTAARNAPLLSAKGTQFEGAAGARAGRRSAEELVTWVDEGGHLSAGDSPGMRPDAYRYQSGAPGARSNRLTGYGQAPYLEFTDASGATVGAKFDSVSGYELIDRKTNPFFSAKAVDQARRQAAVARHYGLTAVWELPNQEAVDAASRFMKSNDVEGIVVRLAQP
jgi:hypothetical protein